MKKDNRKFTRFMDMHSGGGNKLEWEYIYIEAPKEEAKIIFYNKFGRNPDKVSCTCCGPDYSVNDEETLDQATAYDRNCKFTYKNSKGKEVPREKAWVPGKGLKPGYTNGYVEKQDPMKAKYNHKYISVDKYLRDENVKVIYKKEISSSDRKGTVPEQGFVWVD